MLRLFISALGFLTTLAALPLHHVEASCDRCTRIEAERAKEQAAHPEPVPYYDDQINPPQQTGSQVPPINEPIPDGKHA